MLSGGEGVRDSQGANFLIQVLYQHNNTWQGKIVWLDEKKIVNFRSFLEMTLLIKDALRDQATNTDSLTHRWEPKEEVL